MRDYFITAVIAYKLFGIIVRNLEEITYECMVTLLHLCGNDVNLGPFSIYIYGNSANYFN